jgi:hypothetical protein
MACMKHRNMEHISSHGVLDMFRATLLIISMCNARRGGIICKVPFKSISLLKEESTVNTHQIYGPCSMEFINANCIFPIG